MELGEHQQLHVSTAAWTAAACSGERQRRLRVPGDRRRLQRGYRERAHHPVRPSRRRRARGLGDLFAHRTAEHRLEGAVPREVLRREDQLALRQLRVGLLEDLLHTLDRGDVVDVTGDVGLDLRVIDVVDDSSAACGIGRADRDLHARRPQHAALLRHHELDVRVVLLQLHGVAGPAERDRGVAGGEVADVVVAGEAADLAGVGCLPGSCRRRTATASVVAVSGSMPMHFSVIGTESRSSVSIEPCPRTWGRTGRRSSRRRAPGPCGRSARSSRSARGR